MPTKTVERVLPDGCGASKVFAEVKTQGLGFRVGDIVGRPYARALAIFPGTLRRSKPSPKT